LGEFVVASTAEKLVSLSVVLKAEKLAGVSACPWVVMKDDCLVVLMVDELVDESDQKTVEKMVGRKVFLKEMLMAVGMRVIQSDFFLVVAKVGLLENFSEILKVEKKVGWKGLVVAEL
jgi:hypothetical protein